MIFKHCQSHTLALRLRLVSLMVFLAGLPSQTTGRAQDATEALNGTDVEATEPSSGSDSENETEAAPSGETTATASEADKKALPVPEPKQTGGEPEGIVQVANLVYAGTKSSKCFADHFLVRAEKQSAISTSRRFHAVKLSSEEMFCYPLVIMTGEGSFQLTDEERSNLRKFVNRGGFLLASAGCSSHEWNRSFRSEMAEVFPDHKLEAISMDHVIFHTVYDIKRLKAKNGIAEPLEGITVNGRLGVLYSQDGLNDTAHTQGCCCCGGNEIKNAEVVNVNILAYALMY